MSKVPRPHGYYCHLCGNVIAAGLVEQKVRGTEKQATTKLICCGRDMELLHRGFMPTRSIECNVCGGTGLINTETGASMTNAEAWRSDVDQCGTCDGMGRDS